MDTKDAAQRSVDVAIVGAGIGGLTLALALRRHGIGVEVFERAHELREVGAAVALAANGSRVLTDLGLGDQLASVSTVPSSLVYRHWGDARPLASHTVGDWYAERFGGPFWGIHRSDLQRVLADAWGSDGLHLGQALVELREHSAGVEFRFAGGSQVRARVVVGADGVHSTVRRSLTDDVPVYSGTTGFRGLVPIEALPSLPDPQAVQFWMGPGAHLLHYPIGAMVNFLAVIEGPPIWTEPLGTAIAADGELVGHFTGWHPAIIEMLTAVPQSPRWALLSLPSLARWSRDRIVLIGDAAHAMLPHHGQGANQTIEDAAVLADCLAEAGPDRYTVAFGCYERFRRARTRAVQLSSSATSGLLHLPDGPVARARDRELSRLVEKFGWIHAYDARNVVMGAS
ncbi:FAD-dependent monooxygenase [Pseudonocardia sp. T1-2H]|uniref:FAD-dependent monooxygenase n=1 Tax=Pseudonocardia sp. T1-2H TaxID=3128899 RepID=UPI0031015CC1